jgi:ElaB/YqjD/DUF883 family membrane-anchored ribosome-binding protein
MTIKNETFVNGREGIEKKARAIADYPEVGDIRKDVEALKEDVVALTRHVKDEGVDQVRKAQKLAQKKWARMQDIGRAELERTREVVKEHPVQGLAVAFCAGIVLAAIMGRR